MRTLLLADAAVGLAAGGAGLRAAVRQTVDRYNRGYLPVSLLLARCWSLPCGLNRAYESRFLFVGTDEYQRVFRAGLRAHRRGGVVSYALELPISPAGTC